MSKYKAMIAGVAILAVPALCSAGDVSMTANDAFGSSSFTTAGTWGNTAAPSAGNDYFTAGYLMRTPADANNYTFGGDSLTINAGESLIGKGSGARTLTANYIMDGGIIRGGSGTIVETYAGTMQVTGNGGYIQADQANIPVSADISGVGTLYKTSSRATDFSGANTMSSSGGIQVDSGTVTVHGDYSGFQGTWTHNSSAASSVFYGTQTTSANGAYVISAEQGGSQGIILDNTGAATYQLGSLSGIANSLLRNTGASSGQTTVEIGNLGTSTEFAGIIGGGGGAMALTKVGAGTLTLSGISTYIGDTAVSAGTLVLADNGGLKFAVQGTGVNNQIAGTGIATLDGDFTFDLSAAGTTVGDSWNIVDLGSLNGASSFGSTFTVNGFADQLDGTWYLDNGSAEYSFDTGTGALSVIPEPATLGMIGLAGAGMLFVRRRFMI